SRGICARYASMARPPRAPRPRGATPGLRPCAFPRPALRIHGRWRKKSPRGRRCRRGFDLPSPGATFLLPDWMMMNIDLANRNVVVTGGSKGIGLACARAFAAEGARVAIVSRSRDNLDRALVDLAGA